MPPAGDCSNIIQNSLDQLSQGRFVQAQQVAAQLTADPEIRSQRAWIVVAAARQRSGDYTGAADAYTKFLASCPNESLRQFAKDQIAICLKIAQKPTRVEAPSLKLTDNDLLELAKIEQDVKTESSEHFVVHSRNAKLSKLLAAQAEVILSGICNLILGGQEYANTVEIHVWADHAEYLTHADDAPEWSGGNFSLISRDGIIGRRIHLTQLDVKGRFNVQMLDRVLPHEMSHLVTAEFFGDASCPLFLNEGLAMMSESVVDNQRIVLAGTALAGEHRISLEDLLLLKRNDLDNLKTIDVFYAESYSLMCFLHSRLNKTQFRELLEAAKSGCSISEALQRALYMPQSPDLMPNLSMAWQRDAIEQAQYVRALDGLAGLGLDEQADK